MLEKKETVIVWMLYRWGIIEYGNIAVDHFVVSDHKKSWIENGSFLVLYLTRGTLW